MERTPVRSSNVASIGYDPDTATLEVAFRNGSVYHYAAVPAETHQALMSAPSVGSYLGQHIKPFYVPTKQPTAPAAQESA